MKFVNDRTFHHTYLRFTAQIHIIAQIEIFQQEQNQDNFLNTQELQDLFEDRLTSEEDGLCES